MCCSFTPTQRILAKQRARVDVGKFSNIYKWMKCNSIAFSDMDENPKCPEPVITEDKNHKVTDDKSLNTAIEKRCNFKYYFPSKKKTKKRRWYI